MRQKHDWLNLLQLYATHQMKLLRILNFHINCLQKIVEVNELKLLSIFGNLLHQIIYQISILFYFQFHIQYKVLKHINKSIIEDPPTVIVLVTIFVRLLTHKDKKHVLIMLSFYPILSDVSSKQLFLVNSNKLKLYFKLTIVKQLSRHHCSLFFCVLYF